MKTPFYIFVILSSLFNQKISSQSIVLIPDPSIVLADESCFTLRAGSTLEFIRDPSCGPDVMVSDDGGTTALFRTSDKTFSYTFEESGDYIIFCNVSSSDSAVTSLCISVPEIVPTLGEWSVIMLFMMLAIVLVVAYKSQKFYSLKY